jgi:hypothetical protein
VWQSTGMKLVVFALIVLVVAVIVLVAARWVRPV